MSIRLHVDRTSAVPYYHQIKQGVRASIANGELRPGDMLPTEVGLSEQLGVSRLVVHRALRELVTEGLLIRQRGKGTFVAPPARHGHPVLGPLLSMSESLARDGVQHETHILVQEVVPAPEAARRALVLAGDVSVFHLTSLRLADGLPLALEDMYLPASRFPGLVELAWENRSLYATLEELYQAHPQEATDVVSAGSASREEARRLGINKGAPVMRVQRTSADAQGVPIEFSQVVFHAERYQFVARVRRGP